METISPESQAPEADYDSPSKDRLPLRRARNGRMAAGVAAGLADYLAIDVNIVRIGFVVLTLTGGVGAMAYLACLLLIPEEGSEQSIAVTMIDSLQSR